MPNFQGHNQNTFTIKGLDAIHFSRSQLSLIITFFSLAIVVLIMYNLHLGAEEQEEYVIEMSLADEDLEALLEQEERLKEEMAQADPIKSHMAVNQTAKPSVRSPEPLKTIEELREEQMLEGGDENQPVEGDPEYEENLRKLAEKREEQRKQIEEAEAEKRDYSDNLADKRTSISYSLLDRYSISLPPPIYTCIEGGTIVVNIKVDAYGYVSDASYNAKSSNTSNGCLIENAIEYARKARFSKGKNGVQLGTITYVFQSK